MKLALLSLSLALAAEAFVPTVPAAFKSAGNAVSSKNDASRLMSTSPGPNGDFSSTVATLPKDTTVAAVPKVAQRWRKKTKQVATLGPASSNFEMIEKLFLAGADMFRLNFSHGAQEQKKELLTIIREVEAKYSHPIAILGDLQGPKLRVSSAGTVPLQRDSVRFLVRG